MKDVLLKYHWGGEPWVWMTRNEAKKVLLEVGFTPQEVTLILYKLSFEGKRTIIERALERINLGVS